MTPLRGPFRVFVLLLAALQLSLPGVAALADALAARTGAGASAHIEETSGVNCVRVHDAECVFCQFLSTCASPTGSAVPDQIAATVARPVLAEIVAPIPAARRGALLPRAPPLG